MDFHHGLLDLLMLAKYSGPYRPETRDAGEGATCRARTNKRSLIRLVNARRPAEGRACHYVLRNSIVKERSVPK